MISIALAMIVKNEGHVIRRALLSVRPYIAAWAVCDTGSEDDTAAIVQDVLRGIPGALSHDEWVSFAHNRTLSLERAATYGCDYTLVLDADEEFHVEDPGVLEELSDDAYILRGTAGSISWLAQRLIKSALPWRYVGVFHEALDCPLAHSHVLLGGVSLSTPQDGARSQDPDKIAKDLALLEQGVVDEPNNARYWFHLGTGYQSIGKVEQAARAYEQRIALEGMPVEEWYSKLQLGRLYAAAGGLPAGAAYLLEAYSDYPLSAEPLYYLGLAHMHLEQYDQALPYLELACTKTKPEALFMRQDTIYEYEARLYYALCLVRLDRLAHANSVLLGLSLSGMLPEGALNHVEEELLASHARQKVS